MKNTGKSTPHLPQSLAFCSIVVLFSCMIYTAENALAEPVQSHLLAANQQDKEPLRPVSESKDKTLSPFFLVNSEEEGADKLPLKATEAKVSISGVIADVTVTQVYKNEGEQPLEAIYIFPASTRAAVYFMQMTIGERKIQAKVAEKAKAREQYEAAREAGKSASLLEQQRPNVFQMNVANIMPGDEIEVDMRYTELLVPEEGIYEFVYPTVVGPRYSDQPVATASAEELWVANPYGTQGAPPSYNFDIKAEILAGIPIQAAKCLTHDVNVSYQGPAMASFQLKDGQQATGNKDFILQYKLTGKQIESGMLLYEGEKENHFLLMVQPPAKVTPAQIPPREYVFIVDVSGSMNGFPLKVSKKLLKDLIGNLRPVDRFNVVLFAGGNTVMSPASLPATPANIQRAIKIIDQQRGSGGTQLMPALETALNMEQTQGYSRTFIIATDGYVHVEQEAFDLIRNNLSEANFFALGIGSSVNRYIIEGMAHVGSGEPLIVTNESEATRKADKLREYISSPVLTDIGIDFGGMDVYDLEPASIPDMLAERPVIVYGKYRGKASGRVKLTGAGGRGAYSQTVDAGAVQPRPDHQALRYLWARERIKILDDYNRLQMNPERKQEITQLGLDYNLLTAYTSFVAIDSEVRNKSGALSHVKQPLPLPEGVSDHAVGGSAGGRGLMGSASKVYRSKKVDRKEDFFLSISPATEASEPEAISMDDMEDADGSHEKFAVVEKMPEFPGGREALMSFIIKEMKYPEEARLNRIEGTVYLKFTVDKTGKIKDIEVLRSPGESLTKEAIRVLKLMPRWQPGLRQGKAVETSFTLPFKFQLSK